MSITPTTNEGKINLPYLNKKLIYLSKRETEVFNLTLQGKTSSEIAKNLNINAKNISTYLTRIKEKLNIKSLIRAN